MERASNSGVNPRRVSQLKIGCPAKQICRVENWTSSRIQHSCWAGDVRYRRGWHGRQKVSKIKMFERSWNVTKLHGMIETTCLSMSWVLIRRIAASLWYFGVPSEGTLGYFVSISAFCRWMSWTTKWLKKWNFWKVVKCHQMAWNDRNITSEHVFGEYWSNCAQTCLIGGTSERQCAILVVSQWNVCGSKNVKITIYWKMHKMTPNYISW